MGKRTLKHETRQVRTLQELYNKQKSINKQKGFDTMKQAIKERLPSWYRDLSNHAAILTGDIDSLMGYHFIRKLFGCNIAGFFTFKQYYESKEIEVNNKLLFGIDLSILQGKTFDNHLTHFHKNDYAINLNNQYCNKYYQKFPFSTTLLILSLYDFDLESFTDEQLKILLAIDSSFKGYYTDNERFTKVYISWLDKLDIRFLEDRIFKHMTIENFRDMQQKYNLNGIIKVDDRGYLRTNIKLDELSRVFTDKIELPQHKFKLKHTYTYKIINPIYEAIPNREHIISMAWTEKNKLRLTLKNRGGLYVSNQKRSISIEKNC